MKEEKVNTSALERHEFIVAAAGNMPLSIRLSVRDAHDVHEVAARLPLNHYLPDVDAKLFRGQDTPSVVWFAPVDMGRGMKLRDLAGEVLYQGKCGDGQRAWDLLLREGAGPCLDYLETVWHQVFDARVEPATAAAEGGAQ